MILLDEITEGDNLALTVDRDGDLCPQSIEVAPIAILVCFAELPLNLINSAIRNSLCDTDKTIFQPVLFPADFVGAVGDNLLSGERNRLTITRGDNVASQLGGGEEISEDESSLEGNFYPQG